MTSQDAIRKKNAVMKFHHSVFFVSSATRIRTWKMLESESSALPFGDSALNNIFIIIQLQRNVKHFLQKKKKFYFLFRKRNDIMKFGMTGIRLLHSFALDGGKFYVYIYQQSPL